uniref:Uncharacterized protein AlNc14C198G8623 n=1 Tax=Albugo laibachii Nc14 TaxID=890382 RepID=F0WQF3_9STRA|nr:conserved hypothetical protein [Albugo laibachii Nc14]|eukprot:CCA23561.1 conserved hypothetical protein [Albugo laibachii Nc14]
MSIIIAWNQDIIKQMILLNTVNQEDLSTLIRTAINKLTKGTDTKKSQMSSITERYNWEDCQIDQATITLAKVLLDTSKFTLSEKQFIASVRGSGLNEAKALLLAQFYADFQYKIRGFNFRSIEQQIPRYISFRWRIDCQIETRLIRRQMRPIMTFQFTTQLPRKEPMKGELIKAENFRIDYTTLKKLQNEFETALRQAESIHCLRIRKYI